MADRRLKFLDPESLITRASFEVHELSEADIQALRQASLTGQWPPPSISADTAGYDKWLVRGRSRARSPGSHGPRGGGVLSL